MPVTGYTYDGANKTFLGAKTGLNWRADFAKVVASPAVDTDVASIVGTVGTGMTVSQSASNLVITTGTTANQDTIVRLKNTISPASLRMAYQLSLSQRIANQSFFVELVDVIGDGLAVTVTSSTVATVTIPNNPFTSGNVGQFMYIGTYVGTGVLPPNRYAIASVSGNNVTFTIAGGTAGTGTASVFGWNYHHVLYDSTTPTNAKYDAQTRGWASGDTTLNINTTASTGHVGMITSEEFRSSYADSTVNGSGYTNRTNRNGFVPMDASMYVPANSTTPSPMYVQIRAVNGTSAPASTTTLSAGYVAMADFIPLDVAVQDIRVPSTSNPSTVIQGSLTNTISASQSVFATTTTASTNATSVKTSASTLYELTLSNPTATPIFVKFYNKASAPTVGTDVPLLTYPVPAGSTQTVEFGATGKRFSTGIAWAATAAIADTDVANAVAGVKVNGTYV